MPDWIDEFLGDDPKVPYEQRIKEADDVIGPTPTLIGPAPEEPSGVIPAIKSAARSIRRGLSPLIGPTEEQKFEDGAPMYDNDGKFIGREYQPLGSEVDKHGIGAIPNALLKTVVPQVRATAQDIVNLTIPGSSEQPFENLMKLDVQKQWEPEQYGKDLPVDQTIEGMTGIPKYFTKFANQMLPDVAYRILAARGMGALGGGGKVAEAVSTGIAFGMREDGSIDLKQAAVMAILPKIGDLGAKAVAEWINKPVIGEVAFNIIEKEGGRPAVTVAKAFEGEPRIKNELAAKALEEIVGRGGAQTAALTVSQLPEIMALPKEKRADAVAETVAYGMAFSLLSIPGVIDPKVPSVARGQIIERVFGDILKQFHGFERNGPKKLGADVAPQQETQNATDPVAEQAGVQPQRSGVDEVGKTSTEASPGNSIPGATGQPAKDVVPPQAPVVPETKAVVTDPVVNTNPTEEQKKAGNYKKGHMTFHGLDITIENPAGAERTGTDAGGKPWSVIMPAHYGYVKGTEGPDGDHSDVYVGPNPNSEKVFVVDQRNLGDKTFDEHKSFLGFNDIESVRKTYDAAFSDNSGNRRRGAITETTMDEFKDWLKNGDQSKPFAQWQKPKGGENQNADEVQKEKGKQEGDAGLLKPSTPAGESATGVIKFQTSDGTEYTLDRSNGNTTRVEDGKETKPAHVVFVDKQTSDKMVEDIDAGHDLALAQSGDDKKAYLVKIKPGTDIRPEPKAGRQVVFSLDKDSKVVHQFEIDHDPHPGWHPIEFSDESTVVGEAITKLNSPQAWERTRADYGMFSYGGKRNVMTEIMHYDNAHHKIEVQRALNAGKEVPPEVLKDYPGMTAEKPAEKPARSLRTKKTSPAPTKPVAVQQPEGGLEKGTKEKTSPVPKTPTQEQRIDKYAEMLYQEQHPDVDAELAKVPVEQRAASVERAKGLAKNWATKLITSIDTKDIERLEAVLHTGNKMSRKVFGLETGVPLGSTNKAMTDAIRLWVGPSVYDAYVKNRDAEQAKKEKSELELREKKERDEALSKQYQYTNGAGVSKATSARDVIDDLISRGYNQISDAKRGAFKVVRLSNADGGYHEFRLKHEMAYARERVAALNGAKNLTFDEFEKQYREAFAQMQKYSPDAVGSQHWADKMAALSDAHPEWAKVVEKPTTTSPANRPINATKEPWQMTKEEAGDDVPSIKGVDVMPTMDWISAKLKGERPVRDVFGEVGTPSFDHALQVALAIRQGKPVPRNVLAEYPDFQTPAQTLQSGGRGAKLPSAPKEEVKSPLDNLSAEDRAEAERLKKELHDLLGGVNVGIDPTILTVAVKLANLYVKGGAKTFEQFARQVKKDMPSIWERLKAYLRNVWNQIADMLGLDEVSRAQADAVYAELDKPAKEAQVKDEHADEPREGESGSGRDGRSESADLGTTGGERPTDPNDSGSSSEVQPAVRPPDAGTKSGRGDDSGRADADVDDVPAEPKSAPDDTNPKEKGGASSGGVLEKPTTGQDLEGIRGHGENLRLTENPAPTGPAARIKSNIEAVALVRKLENENRAPTHDEVRTLAAWSGWGSFKELFNEGRAEKRDWDVNWTKKYGRAFDQLQKLLSPEEFLSAAESSVNAHYTSKQVIDFAWHAAQRLGFTGGRVLEPSAGSGLFLGFAPQSIAKNSAWTAIELDTITGKILGYLYPKADVKVQGFEAAKLPNGYYDLAISNVPFHEVGPGKEYPDLNLHNYFIARMLDKVRPGGLVVAITTHNTMESRQTQRDLLREKGQLIAAIRLPNNAFKESADTEVVTDMLFLRKPDSRPFAPEAWQHQVQVGENEEGEPIKVNEYFRDNPDMVLGKHALTGTMYRKNSYTVEGRGPLQPQLDEALKRLPADIMHASEEESPSVTTELEDYSLVMEGSHIREAHNQLLHPPEWASNDSFVKRAKQYVAMRDVLKKQYQLERDPLASEADIEANRKTLKATYDRWVKSNGTLAEGERKIGFLRSDPDFYTVVGLENVSEQVDPNDSGKTVTIITPSDVLTKRVIVPDVAPEKAASASDALGVSLAYKGTLDIDYISQLTGLGHDAIESELIGTGEAFKNPESGALETSQVYLTGDVREKLAKAIFAAKESEKFQRNVDALKKVIPDTIPFSRIKLGIAARWVPVVVSNRFASQMMKLPEGVIKFIPGAEEFSVAEVSHHRLSNDSKTQWSTPDMSPTRVLEHALNMRQARIMRPTGEKGKYELDVNATTVANQMIDKVKSEFEKFIRSTDDKLEYRIFNSEAGEYQTAELPVWDILEREFNKRHNSFVVPDFDGSKLKLPGLSLSVRRTPHLMNGVARALNAGSAVFAHGVGSGKTFLEIIASHELMRVGLAKKVVLSVKKPTVAQFRVSIERAYPGSKVLIPNDKDFQKENRRALVSRIASGRYDFVVLSHEQVRSIRPSEKALSSFYEDQIGQLLQVLKDMGKEQYADAKSTRGLDPDVKNIVKQIKSLRKRMGDQLDSMRKRQDKGLAWEDLGIDGIFVDEAHNFKRMPIVTGMENVKGIPSDFSQRAVDLIIKSRDIQRRTGGRNVFFASGTPVSNTLAELWVMFHATNPQLLKDFGLQTFDNFATAFAETVTEFELGWDNKFKDVTRMSRFKNGGALSLLTQMGMDVKIGNKELGLDVPNIEGGKPRVVVIKNHPAFQRWNAFLEHISTEWEGMSKKERYENSWVPIATMRAGAAAALDPRCVFPDAQDHPDSKVNTAVRDIFKEWTDGKSDRTTMMVFADMFRTLNTDKLVGVVGHAKSAEPIVDQVESDDLATAKEEEVDEAQADEAAYEKNAVGKFNVYDDMRSKLVKMGVPEHEIGIITEHDTDAKREALFNKVRNGIVRILFGGTEKIGEGVDVPQRMSAQFHLDPPMQMTPAKMEQRIGRIIRQGNLHSPKNWNKEVRLFLYAQERSMDGPIYQMLESKGKMVLQALRGQFLGDEFEDPASELTMAMAEMKAAATGDTRVLELAKLTKIVRDLRLKEGAHFRRVSDLKRERDSAQRSAESSRGYAVKYKAIADAVANVLAIGDEKLTMAHLPAPEKAVGVEAIDAWLEKERPGFEAKLAEDGSKAEFPLKFGDNLRVKVEGRTQKNFSGELRTSYSASYWVGGPEPMLANPRWDSEINSIESVLNVLKGIPKHAGERVNRYTAEVTKYDDEAKAFDTELSKLKFEQGDELVKAETDLRALENVLRPPPPPAKPDDKTPGNSLSLSGISDDTAKAAIEQFKAENPNAPEVLVTDNSFLIKNNRGVQGDVQDGKIRINRAFITSHDDALEVMREEYAHTLLDRPDVQKQLLALAGDIDPEELQALRDQYGTDATDRDILNEWGAKLNRTKPSLWQRFLEAVRNLLKRLFGVNLSAESTVRAILETEKEKLTASEVQNRQSLTENTVENAGQTFDGIEGVPTEVFGREDRVQDRGRLGEAERAAGADHAKKVFEKSGLQVVQQDNGLFALAAPELESEIEGRKLLQLLKEELPSNTTGESGYGANLLNSVVVNMTQDHVAAFSPQLKRDIYAIAQGERSQRGLMLGALAGFGKTISYVARNVDVVLSRTYSDAFGGERVRGIIQRVMDQFRSYFTDAEIADVFKNHPELQNFVDKLVDANTRDQGGRIYRKVQALLKPKGKKPLAMMEADARIQEAVQDILEQLKKQGVEPKPSTNKPLSPLGRLVHMVDPNTSAKIDEAVSKAVSEAERNAGIAATLKAANGEQERQELRDNFDAGEEPTPDMIEKGLQLPAFSHWRIFRDNMLGYSPVTVKLAQDLIKADFRGSRFGPPSAKIADTRIDLEKLAKQPEAEVQRVIDAYFNNLNEHIVLGGGTSETRSRVTGLVKAQVQQQLEKARTRVRSPMFAEPKSGAATKTPEQRAGELLNAGLFRDPQFDVPGMVERVAKKSAMQKLTPSLPELVKTVLQTPFYAQSDLRTNFAAALVSKLGVSVDQAEQAAAVFEKAFETKFNAARERAQKSALESLTPKEKRKELSPKKPLWKRINEAVNAGVFDSGEILKKVAADHGWTVPDDATIAKIKDLAEQMDRLRELSPKEKALIGDDQKLLDVAQREKEAATLEKRVAIKKQIEAQWARLTKPTTFKTAEGRQNIAHMVNDFTSANLLLRLAFGPRLLIDVMTQAAIHTPTRAVGEAIERWQNDKAAGRDASLWRDVGSALGEAYVARAKGVRNTLLAMRHTMAGTREAVNIDRVMSSISVFDRAEEKARQYHDAGDFKKASAMRVFNYLRFGYRIAQALHNLQGLPAEYQENHARVVTMLRENGMSKAEAFVNADNVIGDAKAEWQVALARAQELSDLNGWKQTASQLHQSALEILLARQYQRIRDLSLPADDLYERNRILSRTLGWGEAETGMTPGGVVADVFRMGTKLLERAGLPMPFLRFGNAIGISINRMLTFTPLGFVSPLFKDSPFFRTEQDRRQRKIESALGTVIGGILFALAAAGIIIVRRKWPQGEAERQLFEKEGHKVGTVEIKTGDNSFIPISTTVGPLWVLQPYLMAGGAIHDLLADQVKKQDALNKEAKEKGLIPGKVKPVDASTMLATAAEVAWQSIKGGRTASGLMATVTSYGQPDAQKAVAGTVSPMIPLAPGMQELSRMAGVNIDPKLATVWDFLLPLPTSGANRVNLLGDKVGTENDLQRVMQILTAGTYGPVDTSAVKEQQAYAVLFASGYRPPSIDPNKGYEINGEFRPLTASELVKYTEERATKLKQELSGLPTTASAKEAGDAFREANTEALSSVGAESAGAQPGSKPLVGQSGIAPLQQASPLAEPLAGGGSRTRSLRSGRSLRLRSGGGRVSSSRNVSNGNNRARVSRSSGRSSGGGSRSLRIGSRGAPHFGRSLRVR